MPRNGIDESRRSIELVERARDSGLDVEFDMHTRRFGITHLYAALPPWALGADDLLTGLKRRFLRAAGHATSQPPGGGARLPEDPTEDARCSPLQKRSSERSSGRG